MSFYTTESTYTITPSESWMCEDLDDGIVGPCFVDGRDDCATWTTILSPVLTPEILADIILKTFIGIVEIDHTGEDSVFFMREGYSNSEDGNDFSHCVSHEIDHDELSSYYYHLKTIGEYLTEMYPIRNESPHFERNIMKYQSEEVTTLKLTDPTSDKEMACTDLFFF